MSTFRPTTDDDGNDSNQNQICRICFSSSSHLMPAPCNCSGSVGYVHKRCFRRWMESVRNFDTCEICHERYEKSMMIPKRSFKKLFMAFFQRPFYAFCKFSVNLSLAAGVGYVLSCELPLIFKFLNLVDVNGESTTGSSIYIPLFMACPIAVAYIKTIEWTGESFGELASSLWDWWQYSWITVQMSNESIESIDSAANLSRTRSDDDLSIENFHLTPLL